jgi:hypothetical protein
MTGRRHVMYQKATSWAFAGGDGNFSTAIEGAPSFSCEGDLPNSIDASAFLGLLTRRPSSKLSER